MTDNPRDPILRVVPQPADLEMGGARPGVDRGDLRCGGGDDRRLEGRIGRDAAAEQRSVGVLDQLAEELDVDRPDVVRPSALAQPVDDPEREAARGRHGDDVADYGR